MADGAQQPVDRDAVTGQGDARRAPGRAARGRRSGQAARDVVGEPARRAAARLEHRVPGRHVAGDALSAFLDDELDDDAALRVTRHVTACAACRIELEDLRHTRSALRRLPALQAPVLTSVRRSLPRVRTWSRRLLVVTAVVTLITVVLTVAYVVGGQGEVVPPVERFLLDHLARTGDGPVPAPFGGIGR